MDVRSRNCGFLLFALSLQFWMNWLCSLLLSALIAWLGTVRAMFVECSGCQVGMDCSSIILYIDICVGLQRAGLRNKLFTYSFESDGSMILGMRMCWWISRVLNMTLSW